MMKQWREKNIVHIWFFGILGGIFQVGFFEFVNFLKQFFNLL